MILNQLGNTGIHLSAIGLGAWAIGGGGYKFGWGSQEDRESMATIHRAIDMGINWIDTAPVYGAGHSEEIVGKAVKDRKNKIFISTKCGIHIAENKEDLLHNLKKNSIRSEVEASLRRLQRDTIDLYQIHAPVPEEDIEEAWMLLGELKKEGKIRCAGVSNFTLEQLKRIQLIHPVSFIQPSYSMLDRGIEEAVMDYCSANDIGIIVFSPMYRGLLTGKFTSERAAKLPVDDNRLTLENYHEPYLSANLRLVESLRPIARRNNKTLAQLAVAWVLRRPEVTAAIVGARRPSQIEETASSGDWILSEEDKKELDMLLATHQVSLETLK